MLAGLLASALFCQTAPVWAPVQAIAPGVEVRVTLLDGRKVQGGLLSATGEGVVVGGKTQETLSRTAIARIAVRKPSHRLRNALIGFGAGAGTGLAVRAISDSHCANCIGPHDLGKEVLTPFGALVGAGVGALLPTGGWRDTYRAK